MEPRIQSITLVVKSKSEALEFYTKKAGFEKKTDVTGPNGYRYVTVGPKGQDLELVLWEMGSPDPTGMTKDWKPGGPGMSLTVDDCRKTFAEMRSRGVQFVQEPEENPWSISAIFSDPDGNRFQINQFRRMEAQK